MMFVLRLLHRRQLALLDLALWDAGMFAGMEV
jgi:hypothetical protein